MDLDGFLERTTSRSGLPARGQAVGLAVNNSLHDVRARLNICSQCLHGKDTAAQLNRRAYTSPYAFFAKSRHAFTGVVAHHAYAGVYVRQML